MDSQVGGVTENAEQTAGSEFASQDPIKAEIEALKEQNQLLLSKLNELGTAVKPAEQKTDLSAEQLKELMAKDPQAAVRAIISSEVHQKVSEVKSELTRTQWDEKALQDFPQLKKDASFQKLVSQEINDLVDGEVFTKKSPKLLYKAAQIAAAKYTAPAAQSGGSKAMTGEAPRAGQPAARPNTDQNFERMAKLFGIKDVDGMKQHLNNYNARKR